MTSSTPSPMEQYLAGKLEATRVERLISIGAILGAVVLVAAAGRLVGPINVIRQHSQLSLDPKDLRGLPPDIALMTKTGTLRGLAIDVAFIRLEELKQENRYYELMQLSDWLCKLAPRYASVWQYSAWNMAYNISVCQYTPEARWLWVRNGLENLRDRGLRYNPKSISLYKELTWIYLHKIGDKLDDYHVEYKKELAVEMERILGEPPLTASEAQTLDAFRAIQQAPRDLPRWIAEHPEAAALVGQLHGVGLAPDESLLEFVAQHLRKHLRTSAFSAKAEGGSPDAALTAARLALLQSPPDPAVLATLLAAVRAQVLRDKLNMDVDWMMKLMEEYGPLDWRNPFAMALYWATYGDMTTKGVLNINPNDSMNTVRYIFFALANLFRAGNMVLEPNFEHPNRSFMQMLPDSRYIKHLHQAYLKFGKEQFGDDPQFKEGTSGPNYWAGHKNFLATAIRQLYLEGGNEKLAEAKDYYFYLREYDREDDGQIKAMYQMPFDDFVLQTIFESLETQVNAQSFIAALLLRSLEELGNDNAAASLDAVAQARKAWNYYMRDTVTDRNARRKLEPLGVIRRDAALIYFQSHEYSLLQKSRVWRNLDRLTRQATYDAVREYVEAECADNDPPYDAAKVLPEPPGMDDFRRNQDARMEGLQRLDPSTSQGEKPDE